MLGRLACIIAKEIMNGQRIVIRSLAIREVAQRCVVQVVVRCEEVNISGSLFRNKREFATNLNMSTMSVFCSQVPGVPQPQDEHKPEEGQLARCYAMPELLCSGPV